MLAPPTRSMPNRHTAVVQSVEIVKQDNSGIAGSGIGLGTIAGAVGEGVVGNQRESGSGDTAAPFIGAAAGAYVGHDLENRQQQKADAYKITVRMEDRSNQALMQTTNAGLRVGAACGSETASCSGTDDGMCVVRVGTTPEKPNMKTQGNDALHLWLMIGVAALMLLGTTGIAAVLAWMPTSTALPGVVVVPDTRRAPPATLDGAEAQIPPARARDKCAECGIVEATHEIEQPGEATDPGAAGAVTRGDRSEITGHSTKTYEVTVRMKDGSRHVFMDAKRANWRPGERVIIIGGASQSNN